MATKVVGIIGNSYLVNDEYPVQACGVSNLEAVADVVGATVLIVPAIGGMNKVEDLMQVCDGFVFTGARPNVHPEEYGEDATEAHGDFDRPRDALTLPLIRACVDKGVPILGICRGFQEFNVAFGGSLYPEIRDLPGRMNHRMPPDGSLEEKFALRHDVNLDPDGEFAKIWGSDVVHVNSLHGQGIKDIGARVIVEGYAPDGTHEAIRIEGASSFAMAVQWHPEWRAGECKVSRPLFEAFGAAL